MSILLMGAGPGVNGSASFTPASVPGLNLWIEADATKLFTDLGSTNVTTDGQAVEQASDKSSAGRNMTQTVSSQRPLYKTDLSKPSLLFDGTDDILFTSSSLSWVDGSGQHWFAASATKNSTAGFKELLALFQGTELGEIYVDTSVHMEERNAAGGFQEATKSGVVAGTPFVAIGTVTSSGGAGGFGQITAYLDNVAGTVVDLTSAPRTDASTAVIGNGSSWDGRIFGVCHGSGTLSSTDRANLQTYLAALHP